MNTTIDFTRINNDVNGNPRYVFHYTELINERDEEQAKKNSNPLYGKFFTEIEYEIALKKARKIGGRKFHNKQYGGGIVVTSYNLHHEEKLIKELKEN